MSANGDVSVEISFTNPQRNKDIGRYKWSTDISEKLAVASILNEYSLDELNTVATIRLTAHTAMPWLPNDVARKYTFFNPAPAPPPTNHALAMPAVVNPKQ